jgi:hypothetical protein
MGSPDGVLLAWTPSVYNLVRVLRRADGTYPTTATDAAATVVYEGSATTFTDRGLAAGTYRYSMFSGDGAGTWSNAVNVGSEGTILRADGLASVLANADGGGVASVSPLSCAWTIDGDRDGSFQSEDRGGALRMQLRGLGRWTGDGIGLCFRDAVSGRFALELDVTMASRLDQNWNLIFNLYGAGGSWNAIRQDQWNEATNGWATVFNRLQPSRSYKLSWVVDGALRMNSFYLDEVKMTDRPGSLTTLSRMQIRSYGYPAETLTYSVDNIRLLNNWPAYHVPPALDPPVTTLALGAPGGAVLAWTPSVYRCAWCAARTTTRRTRPTARWSTTAPR